MKKQITFVDANKKKVNVEIRINNGKFSMSGDIGNGCGQIQDGIEPDNEGQEMLIDLWEKYHLNGMKAGTPRQMELVKGLSYEDALEKLLSINRHTGEESANGNNHEYIYNVSVRSLEGLERWADKQTRDKLYEPNVIFDEKGNEIEPISYYEYTKNNLNREIEECFKVIQGTLLYDTLPNGHLYKYGSGWLTEELPEDIEDLVVECITLIKEYEEERKGDTLISDLDKEEALAIIREVSDDDEGEIYAICNMFDLTANEIDDIAIEGNNRICVQGVDYLFGTDDEMDTAWDEALDNYLEECVYPELSGHLQNYFDDEAWKSDARMDGRGHSLNHYDGGELSYNVGEVYYYAYRQ